MSYISRYRQLGDEQNYPSYMDYSGDDGWTLYGVKVEALSAPVLPGSVLSFATDDEAYGGIWRALGPE